MTVFHFPYRKRNIPPHGHSLCRRRGETSLLHRPISNRRVIFPLYACAEFTTSPSSKLALTSVLCWQRDTRLKSWQRQVTPSQLSSASYQLSTATNSFKYSRKKLLQLVFVALDNWKCSPCLPPNASVSSAIATTRSWHCCLGIVHTVLSIQYCPHSLFLRCLSREQLPPCTSQLQRQGFKIKARKQKLTPEVTVVKANYYKNLVPTLFSYTLSDWGL